MKVMVRTLKNANFQRYDGSILSIIITAKCYGGLLRNIIRINAYGGFAVYKIIVE